MAYRKKGRVSIFYVFYDDNDFVKFFGTACDLVAEGRFKNVNSVVSCACHQNKRRPNSVVTLPVPRYARRSVLNVR